MSGLEQGKQSHRRDGHHDRQAGAHPDEVLCAFSSVLGLSLEKPNHKIVESIRLVEVGHVARVIEDLES